MRDAGVEAKPDTGAASLTAPLARAPSRRTAQQNKQHKHLFSVPLPHLWTHGHELEQELESLLHTITTLPPHLRHHRDEELFTLVNDSLATLRGGAPLERSTTITTLGMGPPPDGGREAWLCILSAFLILASVFGFGTS